MTCPFNERNTHTHTYKRKAASESKNWHATGTHTHRQSTRAAATTKHIEVKASKQWITQPGSLTPLPSPDPAYTAPLPSLFPTLPAFAPHLAPANKFNLKWTRLRVDFWPSNNARRQRCTTRQSPRGKWKSACKRKSTLQARRQLTSSLIPELLTTRPQFASLPPLSLSLSLRTPFSLVKVAKSILHGVRWKSGGENCKLIAVV